MGADGRTSSPEREAISLQRMKSIEELRDVKSQLKSRKEKDGDSGSRALLMKARIAEKKKARAEEEEKRKLVQKKHKKEKAQAKKARKKIGKAERRNKG